MGSDQYNDYQNAVANPKYKTKISHELIAGAASYEAAKAYEKHVENNGGVRPSNSKAKEILYIFAFRRVPPLMDVSAGFATAFINREIETRDLDFIDLKKAQYEVYRHAEGYLSSDN